MTRTIRGSRGRNVLRRIAVALVISGGASLACVAPAAAASGDTMQLISQPSPHCYYYHHLKNGVWRGIAYGCTTNLAGNPAYEARVVCRDIVRVDRTISGPARRKPALSIVDCPGDWNPVRGGYHNPA